MKPLDMLSDSAARTQNIGTRLGKLTKQGDIILLVGTLGAGKTCLTQGIARGLGINEYTTSPSFVLVREHLGKLPLYHIDLYRLDRIEEISQLGLDDYLYGNGVCVVEWADKGLNILSNTYLLIEIKVVSSTERKLTFTPQGIRYESLLTELQAVKQNSGKQRWN